MTPTIGGQEDAVLRVLGTARIFALDQLGFSAANLANDAPAARASPTA
ncbi:MAG: hypothetical protein MZU95_13800 [Desulfomicrobium escambiense]|nr:hypothetical protein [Desulfomicrobium escambiense]